MDHSEDGSTSEGNIRVGKDQRLKESKDFRDFGCSEYTEVTEGESPSDPGSSLAPVRRGPTRRFGSRRSVACGTPGRTRLSPTRAKAAVVTRTTDPGPTEEL